MKKLFTTLSLAVIAMTFNANAMVWLVGDGFNGWGTSNNIEMTLEGDSIYTWTGELMAGASFAFFKGTQDWGSQRGPARGDGSAPTGDWEDTQNLGAWKLVESGIYEIKYNTETNQAKISINNDAPINPAQRIFAVTGTAFGGWNMPPEGNQVFANNGDGTYTLEYEGALASDFKLSSISIYDMFTNEWSIFDAGVMGASNLAEGENALSASYGTSNMTFPVSGNVILTISDVTKTSCTLKIELQQEIIPEKEWYIAGDFTGWGSGKLALTKNENDTYSITVNELQPGAQFKFINENEQWFGGVVEGDGNYGVNPDVCTNIELSTTGSNFQITNGGGNLTFTIDADNKLTITGWEEVAPADPAMYIIGSFNGWDQETQEAMTACENNTWTITKNFEANVEFKLRNELGTWIGAQAENTFVLTEELVGTDITMGEGNAYQNITIPTAGKWLLTFDRNNMKLVIDRVSIALGDLTGDDIVDIEDVNAVINIILKVKTAEDYPGIADINNDTIVDIEDVNAVINIILSQNN